MVQKYRAFRDHIRLLKPRVENGAEIIFYLPMPKSWSKKKKSEMDGQPHRQTPDLDNLAKSFLDSVFDSDAHFSALCLEKYWAKQGGIEVVNEQG
ncbi:RusA family crossover junction endodeoxyribonuclease [candidate division KSB1 bacterium]|nr:RusA family crossover junction endodeoxyribonuclease [candidate division KSB1 bacterium]NIS28176.1 RusA family crossover junction endodeoxyribonuclease [candidate division KSB1 bacterium]NIU28855.1 RusA family crossover junction endodeoxyribonuclease [candidate division KSB1 bacterium]NIU92722.1 RusA family crossover junction endodeoxyribonuclease [candidate division KSB1 bacterium]NIW22750.1 RusA family crossover junction endodeoxyribonuclease [candidate division KSB1 bacterium]